jgi:hypothetical protein
VFERKSNENIFAIYCWLLCVKPISKLCDLATRSVVRHFGAVVDPWFYCWLNLFGSGGDQMSRRSVGTRSLRSLLWVKITARLWVAAEMSAEKAHNRYQRAYEKRYGRQSSWDAQ